MMEVNKPLDTSPNTRCYKCKAEFYVHPMIGMNAPFITDCELHNPVCEHEEDGSSYLTYPAALKCKKCGEFYR